MHPNSGAYIDFRAKYPIFLQDVRVEKCDICGHAELIDSRLELLFEFFTTEVKNPSQRENQKKHSTKQNRSKHEFEL